MAQVSIAIEGDRELGLSYLPQAQQLLNKLRMQMAPGGISTSRAYLDLPDGAYAYAISAMGIEAIRIVATSGASSSVSSKTISGTHEPDFVSGVGVKSRITGEVSGTGQTFQSFFPTAASARLHGLSAGVPQPIKRLAVLLNSNLQSGTTFDIPQIAELKPTLYSGSMKEVVQLLLGFGRQNPKSIYDKVLTIINKVVVPKPTTYEKNVASNGLQVLYDYRFYRTHGISWSTDGKPWLIEISTRNGVLAMPLPLHPATKTTKFRDKLALLGDDDGLKIYDRFGGYPTGENFPTGASLESAIRAGIVLRLKTKADIQPFYDHTAYSSSMGWAFNNIGSEAHNTCYRFAQDGIQTGSHYCITMQINNVRVAPALRQADPVRTLVRNKAGVLADVLLKKCDWLTVFQIKEVLRAQTQSGSGIAALDALTLSPIATGNASFSLSGEGRIYWPSVYCPQIKFSEPLLGYLLSHDMRPYPPPVQIAPECDTTMHVFFAGDVLKYCKFYRTNQAPERRTDNDFEECMYVGSWTETIETDRHVPSMFYTTDFDDREEIGVEKRVTNIVSKDLGYTSCVFGDTPQRLNLGFMFRTKTFKRVTTINIRTGISRQSSITVPAWTREAYAYAKFDYALSDTTIISPQYINLTDPYSYATWRNLAGYTAYSGIYPQGEHPAGCGKVTRRTVNYEQFDEYVCSDFANQGPWSKPCDDAERMAYVITLPTLSSTTTTTSTKSQLDVTLVSCSDHTPLLTKTIKSSDRYFLAGFWFIPSPDPETGFTAFMYATHNALGDANAMKYSSNIQEPPNTVIGTPHYPLMETENTTFIGVINA